MAIVGVGAEVAVGDDDGLRALSVKGFEERTEGRATEREDLFGFFAIDEEDGGVFEDFA